jgi:hypothetical protein
VRLRQKVPVFLLLGLLLIPVQAVVEQRAHSWKPQRILGSDRLPVEAIQFVVLPVGATDGLRAAVDDFLDLTERRFGHVPKLVATGRPKNALYFERMPRCEEMGGAFTIIRERRRIFIHSHDAEGWANALYTIAETMLGARWYWSGDLGFEWVTPQSDDFPLSPWRERPTFVQRRFHPADTDYARRNRLNRVYDFNHNLADIFTRELFETHPEVFAEINGRQKPPRDRRNTDPQPDFTHPKTVEVAARAALSHFQANPESTSFSLSINDNALFDTTAETEAVVSPLRYFRGRPNYSNLVFGFMNRVAEKVFEEANAWQTPDGKDRYLTALAYYWTEPAPEIPIHPRVMPVLTSDRAQWHDPDYRAQDKALIKRWVDSGAERIATWDYYFGAPYFYPRQFNRWIAKSLRFMADSGVDVFFSQLPAFWGLDGAKPWLGAQLLWDARQEAPDLLNEYYHAFFGPAAEPMRQFYEIAETHRDEREGMAEWIKLYKDESGIALFSSDVLREMRTRLDDAAIALAPTAEEAPERVAMPEAGLSAGRYAKRVQVVSRAFRLTELYAALDRSRQALVRACLDGESSAMVEDQLRAFLEARRAYRNYFGDYFANASHAPARRHFELQQSDPEALARGYLSNLAEKPTRSLLSDPELKHRAYRERNFLGPRLPVLKGWNIDYRPSERLSIGASAQSAGAAGLRIQGADMLSLFRRLPVVSNQEYRLSIDAAWQVSLDNRVHLHLTWLDRDGKPLGGGIPMRWPIEKRGEPVLIQLPLESPNNAYDLQVRIVVSRQYPGDFLDIGAIDFAAMLD